MNKNHPLVIRKSMSTALVPYVFVGTVLLAGNAMAAIDTTTILAGVTEAGVAILAVIGALLALSVSIFGIKKVYSFVSAKAGA